MEKLSTNHPHHNGNNHLQTIPLMDTAIYLSFISLEAMSSTTSTLTALPSA